MIKSSDEIAEIISIQRQTRNSSNWKNIEKFITLCDGSMDDTFKVYLKKMRIPFDQDYIDKLVDISHALGCLIMDLKVHFQRPRPFQVAYYTNQKLHPMTTLSGQSPAFPSGHAQQAGSVRGAAEGQVGGQVPPLREELPARRGQEGF